MIDFDDDECAESMEERMENYDYDTHHYSADNDANRRDHVTDPRKTLQAALEKHNTPEVREAEAKIASQILNEKKRIRSCDFASWMQRILDRLAEETDTVHGTKKKAICATTVLTPLIRLFAADYPEVRDYIPLGKSKYDYLLYEHDPDKFRWLIIRLYNDTNILTADAA